MHSITVLTSRSPLSCGVKGTSAPVILSSFTVAQNADLLKIFFPHLPEKKFYYKTFTQTTTT
jgi:hypothetical protein